MTDEKPRCTAIDGTDSIGCSSAEGHSGRHTPKARAALTDYRAAGVREALAEWTQKSDGDYWRHPSGACVLELSDNRGCNYWADGRPGNTALGTVATPEEAKRLALLAALLPGDKP